MTLLAHTLFIVPASRAPAQWALTWRRRRRWRQRRRRQWRVVEPRRWADSRGDGDASGLALTRLARKRMRSATMGACRPAGRPARLPNGMACRVPGKSALSNCEGAMEISL